MRLAPGDGSVTRSLEGGRHAHEASGAAGGGGRVRDGGCDGGGWCDRGGCGDNDHTGDQWPRHAARHHVRFCWEHVRGRIGSGRDRSCGSDAQRPREQVRVRFDDAELADRFRVDLRRGGSDPTARCARARGHQRVRPRLRPVPWRTEHLAVAVARFDGQRVPGEHDHERVARRRAQGVGWPGEHHADWPPLRVEQRDRSSDQPQRRRQSDVRVHRSQRLVVPR